MEDPTGKPVPLYVLKIAADSNGKTSYVTEKDGNPVYLGGVESIARTSAGVVDFPRKAEQTFFADPSGNTTNAFRGKQKDSSLKGENNPIKHLEPGIDTQYHDRTSFENSTAILSTAQTFFTNSYAVGGNLYYAQDFKSYKAADLQAESLYGQIGGQPIVCPIYQAYKKDTDIIKMKEYYLGIPGIYSPDAAEQQGEIDAYRNDNETKLQGIINGLLDKHYNDPNKFEEELIAELKKFPGASLLVVDNGVQKHAINYVGTEPDAATLVLNSVDCLSNWDTQTKCREVLKQLNTSNTQYTAETFLQALRLPTKGFEHKVMLRLSDETDPLKGFFMKLGVSLVAIGKSIFNWLLPKTPPRYPTLNLSGLRDLWSDSSNLSKIHSKLAPFEHPKVKLTNNPLYEEVRENNNTYEDPSQFEGDAHPLESAFELYRQVAQQVYKDKVKGAYSDSEVKKSLYQVEITLSELNLALNTILANDGLYGIQIPLFSSLGGLNAHLTKITATKPNIADIYTLLPFFDEVGEAITKTVVNDFQNAGNFPTSRRGRGPEVMIGERLDKLKGIEYPQHVETINYEEKLLLFKHSAILTVGKSTWIRPSNQIETVIKNQLMFGQLCGDVTEETLAEYNRFSHALGQSYVTAQSATLKSLDSNPVKLQAHKNIEVKLSKLLDEDNGTKYKASELVKKLNGRMKLSAEVPSPPRG